MARKENASLRREWEQRLVRYRRSGLSVSRFCASEGVSTAALYYWKRRLASQRPRRTSFVPVSVLGENLWVEVQLPNRTVVRLPQGLAASMLDDVLTAAARVSQQETRPC